MSAVEALSPEALIECVTNEFLLKCGKNFVLKDEQNKAITDLQKRDVLAILPTGFGKSLIYQYFAVAMKAKKMKPYKSSTCAAALVICPLTSIIDDQISEAENLGISACRLNDALKDRTCMQPKQLMFASAEDVLSTTFQNLLKDSSAFHDSIELLVIDESHTVETWTGMRYVVRYFFLNSSVNSYYCIYCNIKSVAHIITHIR